MRQRAAAGDFDSDLEEQQQQQQYQAATATAASGDDSGSMAGTLTAAEQKLQELAELQVRSSKQRLQQNSSTQQGRTRRTAAV